MPSEQVYDPACLPDLLPIYYKRLFPYGPYFRWLHYGGVPRHYFTNREFSFTLKYDVYIRYQSFADQQELEKEIQKRCPYKIDIGAVFSHKPKEHKTVKSTAFQAQEKELVFDIDMTDYDEVRNCCSGADICRDCWPLMTIAVKIIDRALREDFGFEHLLWVYSGRRGIHCWVCDEAARKLSQNGRTAIAEYLSLVKGGENQTKKVILDEVLHPSIQHSLDIVEKYFENYAAQKQDFLRDEERCNKVLALLPDEVEVKQYLEVAFEKAATTSRARWIAIKTKVNEWLAETRTSKEHRRWKRVCEEIMLQYVYPRLDVNVSKGVNHLLKSPFCIHPKAGRVCVPMDPEKADDFDPLKVPTINQLLDELNASESSADPSKKIKDYKKTSMKESVEVFERFVEKLQSSWKGKLLEQSDMKMEV